MKGQPVIINMELEKDTKNTYRYKEVPAPNEPPRVKHLYVQKWALPLPPPTGITVTIDTD